LLRSTGSQQYGVWKDDNHFTHQHMKKTKAKETRNKEEEK
jgi:hypothetical protein